jgi:hypothetical protein
VYLLGQRADVNWIPSWEQKTPLDAALRSEALELANWLLERGAVSAN